MKFGNAGIGNYSSVTLNFYFSQYLYSSLSVMDFTQAISKCTYISSTTFPDMDFTQVISIVWTLLSDLHSNNIICYRERPWYLAVSRSGHTSSTTFLDTVYSSDSQRWTWTSIIIFADMDFTQVISIVWTYTFRSPFKQHHLLQRTTLIFSSIQKWTYLKYYIPWHSLLKWFPEVDMDINYHICWYGFYPSDIHNWTCIFRYPFKEHPQLKRTALIRPHCPDVDMHLPQVPHFLTWIPPVISKRGLVLKEFHPIYVIFF